MVLVILSWLICFPGIADASVLIHPDLETQWRIVNDGVMGGRSRSSVARIEDGYRFSGYLSLENNGGFASTRVRPATTDLSKADGLRLRVRGDGRTYQIRIRMNGRRDGVAYAVEFSTREGQWIEWSIPFEVFQPTWRGRLVRDAPTLDPARIQQLTFMIADGQQATFQLDINTVIGYTR